MSTLNTTLGIVSGFKWIWEIEIESLRARIAELERQLTDAKQGTGSDSLSEARTWAWSARSHLRLEEFSECEDRLNRVIAAIDAIRREGKNS